MNKHIKLTFSLLLVLFLLAGCGKGQAKLPKGVTLEAQSDGSTAILKDGQTVGGIVRTNLPPDIALPLVEGSPEETTLLQYLESYIEPPLVMEYMMSSSPSEAVTLEIDLIAYDTETQTAHECNHYLYPQDSVGYDLWVDRSLVDWETEEAILVAQGLRDAD